MSTDVNLKERLTKFVLETIGSTVSDVRFPVMKIDPEQEKMLVLHPTRENQVLRAEEVLHQATAMTLQEAESFAFNEYMEKMEHYRGYMQNSKRRRRNNNPLQAPKPPRLRGTDFRARSIRNAKATIVRIKKQNAHDRRTLEALNDWIESACRELRTFTEKFEE